MDKANRAFERVWISVQAYVNHCKTIGDGDISTWCNVCLELRDLLCLVDKRCIIYLQGKSHKTIVSPATQCDMVEALCKHILEHFQGSTNLFFNKYSLDQVATQIALLATNHQFGNTEASDHMCLLLTTCFPAR